MTNEKRFAYSCPRCAAWFYATEDQRGIPCPVCDKTLDRRGVVRASGFAGTVEQLACSGVCQSAVGTTCDCRCRGENHGRTHWVTITVDAGRPRINLADDTLAALRDARLPLILQAEDQARALVAALEVAYADVLPAYRDAAWLSRPDFERVQEWGAKRTAIRHALTLKTPQGRLRALSKIVP